MRYGIYIILSLSVFAFGCSRDNMSDGSIRQPEFYDVEVRFDLNSDKGVDDGSSQAVDMTFVPDGTIIPQQEPPRMLLSSNNWQQINDVRIYVFRRNEAGDFTYYKPIVEDGTSRDYLSVDEFTLKFSPSPYVIWWGGPQDQDESHCYVGRMRLENGEYTFLAVARDDSKADIPKLSDPNNASSGHQWEEWVEGETLLKEATLYCASEKAVEATELFSGCTTQSLTVNGTTSHFSRSIFLERAVAGLLLYVENIPATLMAYAPDTELATGIIPEQTEYRIVGLALAHGTLLSDKVLIASREAMDGELNVPVYNFAFNPPTPEHVLLKIDIPGQATISNGFYENTSPDNKRHPNSLLAGAFVIPQHANAASSSGSEIYDKSLYLVFYGYDESSEQEFALGWIPISLDTGSGYDIHYYPILANHFYSIGRRCFTADGSDLPEEDDKPLDLREGTTTDIVIRLDPFWNEYYGGELGEADPGLGLDPEWGDHPAGNLQQ